MPSIPALVAHIDILSDVSRYTFSHRDRYEQLLLAVLDGNPGLRWFAGARNLEIDVAFAVDVSVTLR